jgi:hypothetical protein
MSTSQRAAAAAVLCAALIVGVTACGGSGGGAGAKPVNAEAMSAQALNKKALADFKAAKSVHMVERLSGGIKADVVIVPGHGCSGTVDNGPGEGTYRFLVIGSTAWVKPDAAFWKIGAQSSAVRAVEGKYLRTTVGAARGMGTVADSSFCDLDHVYGPITVRSTATKSLITLDGEKAIRIQDGTVLVLSDSPSPLPLQIEVGGGSVGKLDFSGYDAAVTLTAPPADQVADGTKFGA